MRVLETEAYRNWIDSLEDRVARARILVRVDRLADGNPGKHRNLPGGISELKIDFGPGYRVYYTKRGSELIALLAGGDKSNAAARHCDGDCLGRQPIGDANAKDAE